MHASLGAHTVMSIESKQLYFNASRNTPKPDAFHEVINDFVYVRFASDSRLRSQGGVYTHCTDTSAKSRKNIVTDPFD